MSLRCSSDFSGLRWPPPLRNGSPPGTAMVLMSPSDLDQLLGPIALYPDPLISELLPAATLPSQIVLADRLIGQIRIPAKLSPHRGTPLSKPSPLPGVAQVAGR